MIIPPNIDPFNLVSLSDEINDRCLRIMASDFSAVVNEASLNELKEKFRDETISLFTEMLNDWQDLRSKTNLPDLMGSNWIIPTTVEMMVQQFPHIYQAPENADSPKGQEAYIQWCADRVQWTVNAWMQVWGQLLLRFPPKVGGTNGVTVETGGEKLHIDIPRPSEIFVITRIWQMVRLLTLEYLQKKAQLLTAIGEDSIQIDVNSERDSLIDEANHAFWKNQSDSHILLLQALRHALLQTLRIDKEIADLPGQLSTSNLLALAHASGLKFPVDVQVLGNIVFDLEQFQNSCKMPEVSYLYPAFRILDETVRELLEMPFNAVVHKRVLAILKQPVGQ